MHNYFKAIFFILLLGVAAWMVMPGLQKLDLPPSLFLVVSADGPARPGQTQEIIVNAFARQKNLLVRESGLQLTAALELASTVDKVKKVCNLKQTIDGGYKCSFDIPETFIGSASLFIFPENQSFNPILNCFFPVANDSSLAVFPPPTTIHPGNWLSFRIASINRKTATGNFRRPVRVKMLTPDGIQTINRVLLTDIYGTAVFTTHIHDHAAIGTYEFEFLQENSRQTIQIPITPSPDKNQLLRQLFKQRMNLLQPLSPLLVSDAALASIPLYLVKHPEVALKDHVAMLSGIRAEIDQAFLTYNCTSSEHRQIEVWQDGKVIYNSDLQLEAGRISLPFPHALEPTKPLLFRVWQISSGTLKIHEHATMPANYKLTPVLALLQEADLWTTGARGMSFAGLFFSRPGIFATSGGMTTQVLTTDKPPQLVSENAENSENCLKQPGNTERLLLKPDFTGRSQKRFFVVDNELNLGKYRFSTMKIWLEPARFFTSIISALRSDWANVDFLIGEAECRAIRIGFISLEDQSAELEKLEGILAILTELDLYAKAHPDATSKWVPALNRAFRRIRKLIHTPETFVGKTNANKSIDDNIGPFSPVLPYEISLEKLFGALKPGGKVSLFSGERSIPLALTGNATVYKGKGLPGQNNRIERLVNLRSTPIIVELDFSDYDK